MIAVTRQLKNTFARGLRKLTYPLSISGPYSCIGKQLALMELRYVVANIVHRYNFALAEGEDPAKFLKDMTDGFTLACPPLNLVFTERKTG